MVRHLTLARIYAYRDPPLFSDTRWELAASKDFSIREVLNDVSVTQGWRMVALIDPKKFEMISRESFEPAVLQGLD
jgi:hypothetical protein